MRVKWLACDTSGRVGPEDGLGEGRGSDGLERSEPVALVGPATVTPVNHVGDVVEDINAERQRVACDRV